MVLRAPGWSELSSCELLPPVKAVFGVPLDNGGDEDEDAADQGWRLP